jgi:hypothetical protein
MHGDELILLASFVMVLGIVGFVQAAKTVRYYLDWRLRMAERQSGIGDRSVLAAVQELRAEIAALKRHESDAVLSFDSTLQTLDSRLKHVERRSLAEGSAEQVSLTAAAGAAEETVRSR